ncbi:MAG: 6,7-dimethyl-8-ribityllumazine synthase [Candidatus Paceibacterota bacterium]
MQRKQNKTKYKVSKNKKIAIVVSEYNSDITFPMRDGAIEELKVKGILEKNIKVFFAPGAFEIPIICKKIARLSSPAGSANGRQAKKFDGIIAIGCVIKGDTDHYVYIAGESTRGIMDVMLSTNIPISNAILTVNNLEQAKLRSEGENNKGIEAAIALLKILSLKL